MLELPNCIFRIGIGRNPSQFYWVLAMAHLAHSYWSVERSSFFVSTNLAKAVGESKEIE